MIIKKLELQGFKSFADRTKIVFHPGITAIVGPNGTGKSNLVDAMLWVLGGRRQRTVRADRTDDILFNGNAKRTPISMADVVLSLGGDDVEMAVSHRVFRSGESEYRMDGKSVRLKDIQDELWKHSIGETEYFVIEQGAIGTFVTSKPVEKRSFLEEAAGTAFYKDRKRQAQNKLELSEQNLIRLEDIIIEVGEGQELPPAPGFGRDALQAAPRTRPRADLGPLPEETRPPGNRARRTSPPSTIPAWKKRGTSSPGSRSRNGTSPVPARRSGTLKKPSRRTRRRSSPSSPRPPAWKARSSGKPSGPSSSGSRRRRPSPAARNFGQEMLALELESIQAKTALEEMSRELEGREKDVEAASALIGEAKERAAACAREIQSLRDEHLLKFQELTDKRNDSVKVEKELELVLRQKEKLLVQTAEQRSLLDATGASLARLESEIEARRESEGRTGAVHRVPPVRSLPSSCRLRGAPVAGSPPSRRSATRPPTSSRPSGRWRRRNAPRSPPRTCRARSGSSPTSSEPAPKTPRSSTFSGRKRPRPASFSRRSS